MLEGRLAHSQRMRTTAHDSARRWPHSIGLAAVVGLAYFLVARLSVNLVLEPEGVAVFWPAAGISSGALIALGLRARWPIAAGVTLATIAVHQLIADPLWAGIALGLCNAAEALIAAELIERFFGTDFGIDRPRQVLGLLVVAIIATAVSGVGGAVTYRLFQGPSAIMLTTWQHWFASDAIGIVIVAPLVIGLAAAIRQPLPRREIIEGAAALAVLTVMTGVSISLSDELWASALPVALLFPMLVWVADRCRPVFAAAAAFLVSITVVSTAVFGVGHFGGLSLSYPDRTLPFTDRILQAQVTILFVALGAYLLAALFAERKDSEARLTRANMMLKSERDNKLLSAQAISGTIAHEIRQPLTGIVTNAGAALRWLAQSPPDHAKVRVALNRIKSAGHSTNEVFDAIRALFRASDQGRQQIDVNEVIVEVLQSLRAELKDHEVETHSELTELPLVDGHRGQLREVILNLVHNAIEAMDANIDRSRVLRVTSKLDHDEILVGVKDSGPGINPQKLDVVFGAFFTTKSQGMGLGLAICQMIVEQHGGKLTASSDGKNGALFQFFLPTASTNNTDQV